MVVPQYPNADAILANVGEEMVGEPFKITATQTASIKLKTLRIRDGFTNADLKLRKKNRLQDGAICSGTS